MTRETAIALLNNLRAFAEEDDEHAIDMAIEALQNLSKPNNGLQGSDLISRQDAIDAVNSLTYPSSLMDVKRKLIELPSADRPHGKWKHDDSDNSIVCDKCGCALWANDIMNGEANFCPNCGADMRGETE